MMNLQEARDITAACTANKMASMGIGENQPPSLADYSLEQLLVANRMVKEEPNTKNKDGTESMQMFCDDRLVAALYTVYHYEAEELGGDIDAIVRYGNKALICIHVPEEERD